MCVLHALQFHLTAKKKSTELAFLKGKKIRFVVFPIIMITKSTSCHPKINNRVDSSIDILHLGDEKG